MAQTIKILFSTLLILFFTSCGSSSNYTGEDVPQNLSDAAQGISGVSLSGRVVDGYIKGATVCLSLNEKETCETTSLYRTTTDDDGRFNFTNLSVPDESMVYIVAVGGIDTSTELPYDGELHTVLFSSLLNDSEIIVSPLTDLFAITYFNDLSNQDIFGLNEAKRNVSAALAIPVVDLEKDPMQDISVFIKSQEIQQTKLLLQTITDKNSDGTIETFNLQDVIKKEIVYQSLNISNITTALEIDLDINMPQNEKEFLELEILELTTVLSTLSTDATLNIEDLNRLQLSIHNKIEEASQALATAVDGETIDVVAIDVSTQTITQSIFDTTSAIRDDQACLATNGYFELQNYSGEATADDINNGIYLKSNYTGTQEETTLKIFYPALELEVTGEIKVFFPENNNYYFIYDAAWVDNANKTVYVMTPKDANGLHSCYRSELNDANPNDIVQTKVFSYSNI